MEIVRKILLAALVCCITGCASTNLADRVFTKEWIDAHEGRIEEKSRLVKDELVLVGKDGKARAAMRLDEDGKAVLRVGKSSRFHTDFDVSHGVPDVKVQYKLEWKARGK